MQHVDVFGNDTGFPATDGPQLLLRGAFHRQVSRGTVAQIMEAEVNDAGGFDCCCERLAVVIRAASAGISKWLTYKQKFGAPGRS